MRNKIFYIGSIILFITVIAVFGQTESTNTESRTTEKTKERKNTEVFAPFVSRLRANLDKSSIELTWKDSSDVKGKSLVFRHTEEITKKNIDDADLIATVDSGTEIFIDHPEKNTEFYYAVILEDENKKSYEILIPFRNKTIKGMAVLETASEEEKAAKVVKISTELQNDKILVNFEANKAGRSLIVYRSINPIRKFSDLVDANALRSVSSSRDNYNDFPLPGIPYYYALIDSELVKLGNIEIYPGENSTEKAIEIPIQKSNQEIGLDRITSKRSLPLPYLLLNNEIESGKEMPVSVSLKTPIRRDISRRTEKDIKAIMKLIKTEKPEALEFVILKEDRAKRKTGEEYTLKSILETEFIKYNWKESEQLIRDFLKLNHSIKVEARSRFYLGQCLYYQKKYREAFMEFLLAQDLYYVETSPWLNKIFKELEKN